MKRFTPYFAGFSVKRKKKIFFLLALIVFASVEAKVCNCEQPYINDTNIIMTYWGGGDCSAAGGAAYAQVVEYQDQWSWSCFCYQEKMVVLRTFYVSIPAGSTICGGLSG